MPALDWTSTFFDLGIALGLGLLAGLQREHVATQLAGLRTFALISNLGFKRAAVLVVGSRTLWKKIVPGYLLTVAVGIALVTLSF